jgi:hypothetical protein
LSDITPRVGQIRYNAAEECYEALVTITEDLRTLRIAASFATAMDAGFDSIEAGLIADARRNHAARAALRSTRPGHPDRPASVPVAA